MKKFYFGLIVLPSLYFGQAVDYYQGAENMVGYELKSKLHQIISERPISWHYGDLPTIYATTDVDRYYENNGSLLDIYSEIPPGPDAYEYNFGQMIGTANAEGLGWNREHAIPQSSFNSSYPMYSDLFFVIPTDARINQLRSNYPYGKVGNASYTFTNGSKQGTNAIPNSPYLERAYEPIDEFKGDVARMLLYYVVRYEGKLGSFNYNTNDLPTKDRNPMDGTEERAFDRWYMDMLMSWHAMDPVSQRERDRNNYVYQIQNNRNPFIDHPEWVDKIWNQTLSSTPPQTVTNLKVTKNSAYFTNIEWDVPSGEKVLGYEVYQNGNLIAKTKSNRLVVDRLTPSTTYDYTVVGYNDSYMKGPVSQSLLVTTLDSDNYSNDLFISKFIAGTDSNSAVEVTNLTGHPVNLQGYRLSVQSKGGANYFFEYPLELEGTLEHGKSIVAINPNATLSCYDPKTADFQSASPAVSFTGLYYFELNYKNKTLDAVGVKGQNNSNQNQSLYRLPAIKSPRSSFSSAEWQSYPANYCQDLGALSSHEVLLKSNTKIYPNPVSDLLTVITSQASTYQIIDWSGRILKSGIVTASANTISVSDLVAGSYFLKLDNEVQQFIKK